MERFATGTWSIPQAKALAIPHIMGRMHLSPVLTQDGDGVCVALLSHLRQEGGPCIERRVVWQANRESAALGLPFGPLLKRNECPEHSPAYCAHATRIAAAATTAVPAVRCSGRAARMSRIRVRLSLALIDGALELRC